MNHMDDLEPYGYCGNDGVTHNKHQVKDFPGHTPAPVAALAPAPAAALT
jgi:hypothetical protein